MEARSFGSAGRPEAPAELILARIATQKQNRSGVSRVEVGVRDRLIAVRARSSWSHPTTEQVALLAPADAEEALFTRRALIDGVLDSGHGDGGRCARVQGPPIRLLTGIGAVPAPSGSEEGVGAPGAGGHRPIVTPS
jgi:hypothetical protein